MCFCITEKVAARAKKEIPEHLRDEYGALKVVALQLTQAWARLRRFRTLARVAIQACSGLRLGR